MATDQTVPATPGARRALPRGAAHQVRSLPPTTGHGDQLAWGLVWQPQGAGWTCTGTINSVRDFHRQTHCILISKAFMRLALPETPPILGLGSMGWRLHSTQTLVAGGSCSVRHAASGWKMLKRMPRPRAHSQAPSC